MAAKKKIKVEVSNLGPVHNALFTLEPGINCLTGKNGAGKSTVIEAIRRSLGTGGAEDLTVRDGAVKGLVSLNGVAVLSVGKVARKTGQPQLTMISTSPLGELVAPASKATSEDSRIKALLRMVDCPVTEETIAILVDHDQEIIAYLDRQHTIAALLNLDIVSLSDLVRRAIHAYKRVWEDERAAADGEVRANEPGVKPEGSIVFKTVDEADAHYRKMISQLDKFTAEAKARREREEERERITATLGERPDLDAAETAVLAAKATHQELSMTVVDITRQVSELQAKLAAAEYELTAAAVRHSTAREDRDALIESAKRWDESKAVLGTEIAGANDEDVAQASEGVTQARGQVDAVRQLNSYNAVIEKRNAALTRRDGAEIKAKHLEDVATSVTSRLSGVLASIGLENLTVDDGRLCVIHDDGKVEAYSRLSWGQRITIAAKLLTKNSPEGAVVALDDKYWHGLDDAAKAEAHRIFAEHGLYVITEVATGGDLTVEQFDEGVA